MRYLAETPTGLSGPSSSAYHEHRALASEASTFPGKDFVAYPQSFENRLDELGH